LGPISAVLWRYRSSPARDSGDIPERGRMPGCLLRGRRNSGKLPLPTKMGQTKVGGIDFHKPRMRQVAEAVMALSTSPSSPAGPAGFTASNLAQRVRKMNGQAEADYGPRRAAYDIKKLRGKGMVRKIGTSRRSEPEPDGLRAVTALVVLREKVIKPLLAAGQQPEPQTKPNHPTPVDSQLPTSSGWHAGPVYGAGGGRIGSTTCCTQARSRLAEIAKSPCRWSSSPKLARSRWKPALYPCRR
jgi:hypothetical protein